MQHVIYARYLEKQCLKIQSCCCCSQKFCDICGMVPKVSYWEGSRVFRAIETPLLLQQQLCNAKNQHKQFPSQPSTTCFLHSSPFLIKQKFNPRSCPRQIILKISYCYSWPNGWTKWADIF